MKTIQKILTISLIFLFAKPVLAEQSEERYLFSIAETRIANAIYNVPDALDQLNVSESYVSHASAHSDSSGRSLYRVIVSDICGYAGCTEFELTITEDSSDILADAPVTYTAEIQEPRPIFYQPTTPIFRAALTSMLKNSESVRESHSNGNAVFEVVAQLYENKRKFTLVIGQSGPWLRPHETGLLVLEKTRAAGHWAARLVPARD